MDTMTFKTEMEVEMSIDMQNIAHKLADMDSISQANFFKMFFDMLLQECDNDIANYYRQLQYISHELNFDGKDAMKTMAGSLVE